MEIPAEGVVPQNPLPDTPPEGVETIVIPKKDYEDLQHRAGVSSQNFERLKKAETEIRDLHAKMTDLAALPDPSGENDEEIGKLRTQIADITAKQVKAEVLEQYPQLKEVWEDFESFRADESNKGMAFKTAAKAFLTEKGLLDPQRPGLERATGGDRTPTPSGMSTEEVKKLRETDYKKYRELVTKGIIKF